MDLSRRLSMVGFQYDQTEENFRTSIYPPYYAGMFGQMQRQTAEPLVRKALVTCAVSSGYTTADEIRTYVGWGFQRYIMELHRVATH